MIRRKAGLRPLMALTVGCLALALGLRGPEWVGRGLANLGWVLTLRTWAASPAFAASAWQGHPGSFLLQWGGERAGLGVAYGAVFAGQPTASLPCDALTRRAAPGVPAWHLARAGCALGAGRREEAAQAYYCALLWACNRSALGRFEHDLVRERHGLLALALDRPARESGSSPPLERMKLPPGSVSLPVGSDWALVGLDYDSELLGLDPLVELSLVWHPLSPAAEPAASWQRLEGDLWLERRAAWNLVCDPGFDWPASGCGECASFRELPYAPYVDGVAQVVAAPQGGHGQALALRGGSDRSSAGVRTAPFPVRGGAIYLQAGRVWGTGTGIRLGRQWSGALEGEAARRPYSFLSVRRDRPYQAEVVQAPAGAALCEVWAINWQSSEPALFDDLLFVELAPPGGSQSWRQDATAISGSPDRGGTPRGAAAGDLLLARAPGQPAAAPVLSAAAAPHGSQCDHRRGRANRGRRARLHR